MNRSILVAISYGWITICTLILLFSFFTTLIIRFAILSELTLTYITFCFGLIALFIGGLIAGVKGKGKGWIIGAATGIGFTMFTFLLQYFRWNELFSFQQLIYHSSFIITAITGSIVGVNIVTVKNTK